MVQVEKMMGAGIILMAFDGKIPMILGLIGDSYYRQKYNAIYDLPKGTEDPFESTISCALRETFEETGFEILESELIAGPFVESFLTMWLAQIPISTTITIGKNPVSGKFEHDGYHWLDEQQALQDVYPYLLPFVKWAFQNV